MSRNCEDCSIDGECLLQRTGTLSCNIGSDKRPEHRVKDLDAEVNALVQQLHDIANGYAFYNAPDKSKTIEKTWKFLENGLEEEMKKKENNEIRFTLAPKPVYKVLIKYTGEKDAQLLFFEVSVHIAYSVLKPQVGIYDEKGNCLYLARWDKVDYIQIATDMPVEPLFLAKHMNVPVDPTMGGKVADPIKPSCLGCAYDGPTHCESPTICNKSGHFKPTGYVSSKELKKWRV